MTNSKGDIRKDLLDKYAETKDYQYIEEWLDTEAPIVCSIRVANVIAAKTPFLDVGVDGPTRRKFGGQLDAINPDILSYVYESLTKTIKYWKPEKGPWEHFLYTYVKGDASKRIYREYKKSFAGEGIEDIEKTAVYEEYASPQLTKEERDIKYKVDKLFSEVNMWGNETDLLYLRYTMGEISREEVMKTTGTEHESSFYRSHARAMEKSRNYIEGGF